MLQFMVVCQLKLVIPGATAAGPIKRDMLMEQVLPKRGKAAKFSARPFLKTMSQMLFRFYEKSRDVIFEIYMMLTFAMLVLAVLVYCFSQQ